MRKQVARRPGQLGADGVYIAAAVDVAIATDGSTFEELRDNIRDAVALYFENDTSAATPEIFIRI